MVGLTGFSRPLAKVMVFIDGGYLRENFKQRFNSDSINYFRLKDQCRAQFTANCNGNYEADVIRVYYYDAIVEPLSKEYENQDKYFSEIRKIDSYEVRLGRLTPVDEDGKGRLK